MEIPGSRFKTKRRKSFSAQCMLKLGNSLLSQDVWEAKGMNGVTKRVSQAHGKQAHVGVWV